MSSSTVGLIIGGILPALIYGITGMFAKSSNQLGIGVAPYLIIIGFTIVITGLLFGIVKPDWTLNLQSGLHAFGMGLTWGIGTGLIAIALGVYQVPLGKIVPLYNMNTLLTVLLALWIFSEWKQVKVPQLLIGSFLIVVGGVMVARA